MPRTQPFLIREATRGVPVADGARSSRRAGVVGFSTEPDAAADLSVRYDGPYGPVEVRYVVDPPRTVLRGAEIPASHLDLPAPAATDPIRLRRQLAAGVDGRIGDRPLRVSCATDAPVLNLDVGDERYALDRAGIFPRVLLSRPDLSELATFAVIGRRPHRLVAESTPDEVVLAIIAARFVHLVAYRR